MKRDTETLTQFSFLFPPPFCHSIPGVLGDTRRKTGKEKLLSRNCKKIQGIAFRFVIVTFYAGRKSEDVLENKAKISSVGNMESTVFYWDIQMRNLSSRSVGN